jgi:hypothetical protein
MARFEDLWFGNPGYEMTLIRGIEISLKIWHDLGQDEVLDAWSEFMDGVNPEISIQR